MILKYINFENLWWFQFSVNGLARPARDQVGKPNMFEL